MLGLFLGVCVSAWSPPHYSLQRRGVGWETSASCCRVSGCKSPIQESGLDRMEVSAGNGVRSFGTALVRVQMLSTWVEDAQGNNNKRRTLEDLLSFASDQGAFISQGVGASPGTGEDEVEGLAAKEDIEAGEVVLRLPDILALTVKQVTDRFPKKDLWESTGAESDTLLMVGLVLARRGMMNDAWQRYAEWVGSQVTPDLPTTWQGSEIAALGGGAEGRVMKLRGEMQRAVDQATSVLTESGLLPINSGGSDSIALADIRQELEESWIIVCSRAVSSSLDRQRRFFPILDAIKHAPSPLRAGTRPLDETSGPGGPALKV